MLRSLQMSRRRAVLLLLTLTSALTTGCLGDDTLNAPEPYLLVIVSGTGQSVKPNATLANPLKVKVVDQYGDALPGVTVNWSVPVAAQGSVNPATSITDSQGEAQTTFTAGGTVGTSYAIAAVTQIGAVQFPIQVGN